MMSVTFGTKSETLERLERVVCGARVLPQVRADWRQWSQNPDGVLTSLQERNWLDEVVIVRSSANNEDRLGESLAGRYLSIGDVTGRDAVSDAISRVFSHYGAPIADGEQVFIQPFLKGVALAGVAFSCDPNSGAPYYVINYDQSGDTTLVTSGAARHPQTYYFWKHGTELPDGFLGKLISLLRELEGLLNCPALDIEFAIGADEELYLLQARPVHLAASRVDAEAHRTILTRISEYIKSANRPHPYLHGRQTVFGVMPDWNPAEIVGTRPRPLALSLYRKLVTDQIWAYQRSNYGYKNLRSFPLLASFHGMPYVDVRVSFNSFIPADIEDGLADRLVDHYLDRLLQSPALHDKIEFEIVFSCYTLDLQGRLSNLNDAGFSDADTTALSVSLRRLTNRIIHTKDGLWRMDLARIDQLEARRKRILDADMNQTSRIYWLLEDCKRWGTLPFAGLARAGFIAMQMLKSLVNMGVIEDRDSAAFLASVDTITARMMRDAHTVGREVFLNRYGHLRPGTYDILSPRYDEAPGRYLGDSDETIEAKTKADFSTKPFQLSPHQHQQLSTLLRDHDLDIDATELMDFIKSAVQGREYAKFAFTHSLSDALSLFKSLGCGCGLDAEDLSYADIGVIEDLYASSGDVTEQLQRSIAVGRARYAETKTISLPPLISNPDMVWGFSLPPNEPNYITQGTAEGPVQSWEAPAASLRGAIVFIANADPGFDWIFSRGIAGLVTAYGGVNSHMAIRAHECALPAVIGAGEAMFNAWQQARVLRLDCINRCVEVVRA